MRYGVGNDAPGWPPLPICHTVLYGNGNHGSFHHVQHPDAGCRADTDALTSGRQGDRLHYDAYYVFPASGAASIWIAI